MKLDQLREATADLEQAEVEIWIEGKCYAPDRLDVKIDETRYTHHMGILKGAHLQEHARRVVQLIVSKK